MNRKRGNPNWREKCGEPTEFVRLPGRIAEAALAELKAGTPLS